MVQTPQGEVKKMTIDEFVEMEIDLMGILHKIIAIRKVIYKAAGIGLVIGVIVAIKMCIRDRSYIGTNSTGRSKETDD